MRLGPLLALAAVSLGLVASCSSATDDGDPEDSIAVDSGKEDNFLSASASEFVLTGRSSVTLDASLATASDADRMAAAKQLIGYKQVAIAWFVTEYLVNKESDEANASFGGFGGIAKGGMWQDLDVSERADHLTYDFTFRQLVGADKNLMQRLPVHQAADGSIQFDLEIGKPTNDEMSQLVTDEEWYRQPPWDSWDPSKVSADQKETITFTIAPETKVSSDAFFDIDRLVADGTLDIDVHFGWDYHDNFHLKHSQALFTWLVDQGFKPPVASWDQLTHTSGPFTRTLDANGKTVTVEVRIFFGKPGTVTDPDTDAGGKVLEDDVRHSVATRDVVIYSGHANPFYGFSMANWNKTLEGDFDDAEMRTAPLADKYQIIVAEGCNSYQIGEAFSEKPFKAGKNVDVLTTTSFSNAATPVTTEDFLTMLLGHDSKGRMRPTDILSLLTKLDSESADLGFHTMYGLHGIDEDPTLHPFADLEAFGKACHSNEDCGGPGNLCVTMTGGKQCTAACTADAGCPSSYTCKAIASASSRTIYGRACAR
jgi:hypothetical protein